MLSEVVVDHWPDICAESDPEGGAVRGRHGSLDKNKLLAWVYAAVADHSADGRERLIDLQKHLTVATEPSSAPEGSSAADSSVPTLNPTSGDGAEVVRLPWNFRRFVLAWEFEYWKVHPTIVTRVLRDAPASGSSVDRKADKIEVELEVSVFCLVGWIISSRCFCQWLRIPSFPCCRRGYHVPFGSMFGNASSRPRPHDVVEYISELLSSLFDFNESTPYAGTRPEHDADD